MAPFPFLSPYQLVDGTVGVHGMIPKGIFKKKYYYFGGSSSTGPDQ